MNRRAFIKKINFALTGIIGMLGFAGCDGIGLVEYGTPHADYTVKGSVVNKATGKAVEGIRIGYSPVSTVMPMYGVIPTYYATKSHVLSNAKGEFILTDRFHAGEYQYEAGKTLIPVFVEDIDGEANGLFQPEYLTIDFSKAEQSGKRKSWYEGEFTVTVNVGLTEVEDHTDE